LLHFPFDPANHVEPFAIGRLSKASAGFAVEAFDLGRDRLETIER
jgi:hypothetical protein